MNNQYLIELKSLYEKKLNGKVEGDYCPFFVRMSDEYDGKNGVLFVGKAENMSREGDKNISIEAAFDKAQKKVINKDTFIKKFTGIAGKSAYNRVVQQLAKELNMKGVNNFARTNLYKLAVTKDYKFGSDFDKAFPCIFKKEIELLQPKYVILLTGGLEKVFLSHLGEVKVDKSIPFSYTNKGNVQDKKIRCKKVEGIDSVFITAFHPQGKPEKELVKAILSLIQTDGK